MLRREIRSKKVLDDVVGAQMRPERSCSALPRRLGRRVVQCRRRVCRYRTSIVYQVYQYSLVFYKTAIGLFLRGRSKTFVDTVPAFDSAWIRQPILVAKNALGSITEHT